MSNQRTNTDLSRLLLLISYLLAIIAYWLTKDHPFFWDTVQLGAKHAHFYYENNFQHFLLPEHIDSGHPPFFGMYLAALWQLFGQTLVVSHLAILPFTLMSVKLLYVLGDYFLGAGKGIWLVLLLLADPTFSVQQVLISPDAVVMSFFLLGIYAILFQKKVVLGLAAIGLAAISMRGMMIVVVLYVLTCYQHQGKFSIPSLIRNSLIFVPSGLFALAFLMYHYQQTGWIGYHEDSPWAVSFEKVDTRGFVKNIAIYIWRLLDYGRVFVLLVLVILLFRKWRKTTYAHLNKKESKFRFLLVLLIASMLLLSPTLWIHKYLTAHRYLLPIYFACSLLTLFLLSEIASKKWKGILYTVIVLGLLTGNLWVYPPKVAQGWDASWAHMPYYQLNQKMMDFIEEEEFDMNEIGSVFPEVGARKYRVLNGMENGFRQADFAKHRYIYYSNIMNDFADREIEQLNAEWNILKEVKRNRIIVRLYEKMEETD